MTHSHGPQNYGNDFGLATRAEFVAEPLQMGARRGTANAQFDAGFVYVFSFDQQAGQTGLRGSQIIQAAQNLSHWFPLSLGINDEYDGAWALNRGKQIGSTNGAH
jgi:hypothetical protein